MQREERARAPTSDLGLVLGLGLAAGLLVACAEFVLGVLVHDWSAPRFRELLSPSLYAGVAALVLFVAVSALALVPLGKRSTGGAALLQLALTCALLGLVGLPILARLLGAPVETLQLSRRLAGALLGGAAGYAIGARLARRAGGREQLALWILALPLVCAVASAGLWLVRFELRAGPWIERACVAAVLGACAAIVVVCRRFRGRIRPAPWLAAMFAVAFAAVFLGRERAPEPAAGRPAGELAPPRVILVVIDTLRADALAREQPGASLTPHLDAFAREGIVYTQARSPAPWTLPAMVSMLTGVGVDVHRVEREDQLLPRELTTLAQRLRHAGYRTAAFGRNPVLAPRTRLDRGLDEYHVFQPPSPSPLLGSAIEKRLFPGPSVPLDDDRALSETACRWIESHRGEGCFLWLQYFGPHFPYEPSREFLPGGEPPRRAGRRLSDIAAMREGHVVLDAEEREWLRRLYEGEVRETDASLGRLFDRLRELGLYDDALIVVTSDHGEEFWEHAAVEHGHSVYDEVLRVPLIVKLPAGASAGKVDERVSTEQIVPSVLAWCAVPYAPEDFGAAPLASPRGGAPDDGVSAPVFLSTGLLYFENRSALCFEHFKYVRHRVSGREELYDLASDPVERHELSEREPGTLDEARQLFERRGSFAGELRARLELGEVESQALDEAHFRALSELGYVK